MKTNDDWKTETIDRLERSNIYLCLKERCQSGEVAGSDALALVENVVNETYQQTKTIIRHMGEFTLHDGDHLFRVLTLMERLLGVETIHKLSTPELMLMILTAFIHDIGMAPDEKDVLAWRKVWDDSPSFKDSEEEIEYANFNKFHATHNEESLKIKKLVSSGESSKADLAKSYLISEYIRTTHADRARTMIEAKWMTQIRYRDTNLAVEVANICFSHNEDPLKILELDHNYICGPDCSANLQLVATILRLADLLDFDAKRTPSVLLAHLFVRHPISIKEWNKHRAIQAWKVSPEEIIFHAKCSHPAVESSIHAFCNLIDSELSACNNVLTSINSYYVTSGADIKISIPLRINRQKIITQTDIRGKPLYLYKDTQFTLSKNQVIDLLMGTKLYGDPEVALRELLQNSIDACLLRAALEKTWNNSYTPEITVKYYRDGEDDILEVHDNGTGMDEHIINNYYSKVGSSFYKSSDFYELKFESNADFNPTSRFGIGILSCFMVADTLTVETRRVHGPHASSDPWHLNVEGHDSIFHIKPGTRSTPGTITKLILRKNKHPWDRMDEDQFIKSVEKTIRNPPFTIKIQGQTKSKIRDKNSFEKSPADTLQAKHWRKQENIKEFHIDLNFAEEGFVGSAIIAILEEKGHPVPEINRRHKEIEIEGTLYPLEKKIILHDNEIRISSTSISIDENGAIDESTSSSSEHKSVSEISLHGIYVDTTLFPEPWRIKKNQPKLNWPLTALLSIDVCGNKDLDLNSSRNQILLGDKWTAFEKSLTMKICEGIANSTTQIYWNQLKDILMNKTSNEIFLTCLESIIHKDELTELV